MNNDNFPKGHVPWNKGKKLSAEHRKHISKAKKLWYKTHDSPLKGREMPEELVEKQRQGRLEFYQSYEVNNKGKPHTSATHREMSKGMKRYWQRRKKEEEKPKEV